MLNTGAFPLPHPVYYTTLLTMSQTVYIGIDSAPLQPPFTLAVLDAERKLVALSQGPLAEMLAYAAGQVQAVVAINSPLRPNQGLVSRQDILPNLGLSILPHHESNLRLAELLLRQKGFSVARTAFDPAHCQGYMRRGFALYQQLTALGYQPYPGDAPRLWLETHSDACFQALLDVVPFRGTSLEGRLQRQLVLRDQHIPVPDAMNFFEEVTRHKLLHSILPLAGIHPLHELNALMAAQVAWLAGTRPERLTGFGDPAEGVIFLPLQQEPDPS